MPYARDVQCLHPSLPQNQPQEPSTIVYRRSQATGRRATFRAALSPRLESLATVDRCRRWDFSLCSSPTADHQTKSRPDRHTLSVARQPPAPRLHAKWKGAKLWSLEWKSFLVRAASGRLATSKKLTASHLGTPHGSATAHVHEMYVTRPLTCTIMVQHPKKSRSAKQLLACGRFLHKAISAALHTAPCFAPPPVNLTPRTQSGEETRLMRRRLMTGSGRKWCGVSDAAPYIQTVQLDFDFCTCIHGLVLLGTPIPVMYPGKQMRFMFNVLSN
jgi:hypothetical protein